MSIRGRLLAWLRGGRGGKGAASSLAPLRVRLRLLAVALAGEAVEVKEGDGPGGWRGAQILLPSQISDGDDPRWWVHRVAYAVTSRRLGFRLERETDPEERLLATLLAVPPTLAALDGDLPGAAALRRELTARALAARPDPRTFSPRAAALEWLVRARLGDPAIFDAIDPSARHWLDDATRAVPEDRAALLTALRRLPGLSADHPPPALFGELLGPVVRESAKAKSRRGWLPFFRRQDVDDDLDVAMLGSGDGDLEEVETDYRAGLEITDGDSGVTSGAGPFRYDEWDEQKRAYRLDWCSLTVTSPKLPADGAAEAAVARVLAERAREIRELRMAFQQLAQPRRLRAGSDGEEVDLDALVDRHGALRAGHSPSEKLYLSRIRPRGDLATFLLLDGSLSTLLPAGGRPIVDVVRESVLVLGEALFGLHDRLAIAAFSSETRHACRFVELKAFDEPWLRARPRLAELTPRGFTRIGPAVRHATRLLAAAPARHKVLLLLSDGKPMDLERAGDRYEGRHGIADVRQSLREASRAGLHTFALAVDDEGREWLPQLFGRGRYEVLSDPSQLAQRLGRLHRDLLRG
jgi:nitric oxide reductase NorD protein